jgi:hypothetical protein
MEKPKMSYLDTFKSDDNWTVQSTNIIDFKNHNEKTDFIDGKHIEKQAIELAKNYDNSKKYITISIYLVEEKYNIFFCP